MLAKFEGAELSKRVITRIWRNTLDVAIRNALEKDPEKREDLPRWMITVHGETLQEMDYHIGVLDPVASSLESLFQKRYQTGKQFLENAYTMIEQAFYSDNTLLQSDLMLMLSYFPPENAPKEIKGIIEHAKTPYENFTQLDDIPIMGSTLFPHHLDELNEVQPYESFLVDLSNYAGTYVKAYLWIQDLLTKKTEGKPDPKPVIDLWYLGKRLHDATMDDELNLIGNVRSNTFNLIGMMMQSLSRELAEPNKLNMPYLTPGLAVDEKQYANILSDLMKDHKEINILLKSHEEYIKESSMIARTM